MLSSQIHSIIFNRLIIERLGLLALGAIPIAHNMAYARVNRPEQEGSLF